MALWVKLVTLSLGGKAALSVRRDGQYVCSERVALYLCRERHGVIVDEVTLYLLRE